MEIPELIKLTPDFLTLIFVIWLGKFHIAKTGKLEDKVDDKLNKLEKRVETAEKLIATEKITEQLGIFNIRLTSIEKILDRIVKVSVKSEVI